MNGTLSRITLQLHQKLTGRRILERLEDLNRTQWWGREELLALQRQKIQRLVEYAYQYVPYYRRIFDTVGFHPEDLRRDMAYLTKVPILTKTIIRENFQDLLTTEPDRLRKLSRMSTSGSTGQPLIFMQDPDFRDVVTADIQRHLGWAGWNLGDLHAMIWGARLDATFQQKIRAHLIDWVWNRFQINAFQMTDENMAAFAKQLHRQKPRILFGYPTSIHHFAQYYRHCCYNDVPFDGIFTSGELLLPSARHFLETTFQCKVFNRYGTLDLGGIACECSAHTGLHISVENNYIEVLRNGAPTGPEEVGDIIVTNLNNLGMPFIRYSIGDAGAWYEGDNCSCGRTSPMLKSIEGRTAEKLQTRDGRFIWAGFTGIAFRCFAHPAIKQFQIVQKSLDKIVVRFVLEGEIPQATLQEISQAIRIAFGDTVTVDFEFLDVIPTLPSGKHQYVMSELNNHQVIERPW